MTTTINVRNLTVGFQSVIHNGRTALLGDEPIESNGTGVGFSATDLLLGAIGMCKVATIRFIANKRGYEIGDVQAKLSMESVRGDDGKFTTTVKTGLYIEGHLTAEQKEDLFRHADRCYVVRLISDNWDFQAPFELSEENRDQ